LVVPDTSFALSLGGIGRELTFLPVVIFLFFSSMVAISGVVVLRDDVGFDADADVVFDVVLRVDVGFDADADVVFDVVLRVDVGFDADVGFDVDDGFGVVLDGGFCIFSKSDDICE